MDPIKFPPRDVPLVGQPCTVHPTWFITAPITCNCDAHTPMLVFFGANMPPTICPACLNVFGVQLIQGGGPKGLPFAVAIGVIGRAQRNVPDVDVDDKLKQIAESVN